MIVIPIFSPKFANFRSESSLSSMCKSKKSTVVISPKSPAPKPRTPRPSRSFVPSSSVDPSSSTFSGGVNCSATGSSNWNSSKSSNCSRTSLSSFKDSLPENPHIYGFSEICAATGNFLSKPFSSSSSSSSWRCSIRGKDVIVFQRKRRRQIQLPELTERLSVVCRSHHGSLVKLLGASVSGNYIYLIYEYIEGATLVECLHNRKNPNFTVLSTWLSRMRIASDLAHGLDYIHHCSGPNFIHNHLKSSSIIVNGENLAPKICHFGTAEMCGEVRTASEENEQPEATSSKPLKQSNSNKMKLEGTRGYMAPEFQSRGIVTQKSDVYAFGVIVLELISGNEALKYEITEEGNGGYRSVSVIETAKEAFGNGEGGLRKWVDRRLRDSFPVSVAEKMVQMGLECVEENPNRRPDMGQVLGIVSKMHLESQRWRGTFDFPSDFSVTMAPR